MPVQEFDLIQRIRVEDGIPRVISTTIKVIEGKSETGDDLLFKTLSIIEKMGFYEKFDEKKTSQYIGFRLKNAPKGKKRYHLVLAQQKDNLNISISRQILENYILIFRFFALDLIDGNYEMTEVGHYWVIHNQQQKFLETFKFGNYVTLNDQTQGSFYFNWTVDGMCNHDYPAPLRSHPNIAAEDTYIKLCENILFPYTLQASIDNIDLINQFLQFFIPIILEQN